MNDGGTTSPRRKSASPAFGKSPAATAGPTASEPSQLFSGACGAAGTGT